jgi:hypothetical protein
MFSRKQVFAEDVIAVTSIEIIRRKMHMKIVQDITMWIIFSRVIL